MKKLGPIISLKSPVSTYVRLAPACANGGQRAFISSCGIGEPRVVDGQSPVPVTIDGKHSSSTLVEASVSACRSSKCRLGSSFPVATSCRQKLGPFFVGFANWQGLAVENVDWGPSDTSTVTQAEAKKLVKDAPFSVSSNQSTQDILELIASKERELEALRAALKAKEAAESRAAAVSRDSTFTTSTLPSANFTPLNSYNKAVGADPVNSPTKQPTPTVQPADVPSQASQEISPRPFPPVNQRPNRIRVDRLAGEKYQMPPLHPPGSFRPGSFYDKLQRENKLGSVVNEEISFAEDRLEAVLITQEDGEEKPIRPKRVHPPPKIIPPVEIKPYKSLADRLYEEHFGHPAPPNLQRSYPPGSFYDRCQKEKLKREAEAKQKREADEASQASGFKDVGVLESKSSLASNVPEMRAGTTMDEEDPLLRIQRMPTMPPRRMPRIPYAPSVENRRRNNMRPSPYNQSPYNQQASMMPGDWKCERCSANNFSRNTQCYRCQADRSGEAGRSNQMRRPSSFKPGEQ